VKKLMLVRLERRVKMQVRRLRRKTRDKGLAIRCQIVLLADRGRGRPDIARSLGCSVSWVGRVLGRFRECGVAGLHDRREDNGEQKLSECYLSLLYDLVNDSPQDYGYPRPTWTRELLAKLMEELTGVKVHPATMSRALKAIGARRGRPRPRVRCPWAKARKQQHLEQIRAMLASLPRGHAAVYLDEVDVHLNPKIGLDWMNRGRQKEVMTPGSNVKRYLCGAMDAASGQLCRVKAEKKNSLLFVAMLRKLAREAYPDAKVIHVVLDNYRIHSSRISQDAVAELGGRIVLHFLPPYCPDENKIERVWLDLHANVTRNHRCTDMEQLTRQVTAYLAGRNRQKKAQLRKSAKAA
jgi:transposase